MVSVAKCDRDVLRFLWVSDVSQPESEPIVLRFARVVFGVSASPFLLNATINHHMEKFKSTDHHFVEKFRRSVYVDDLTTGSGDVESAYEFYIKAKLRLAEASFNLRKFESNSPELRRRIQENEQESHQCSNAESVDKSNLLSDRSEGVAIRQVLGVDWDVTRDRLIFDISDVARLVREAHPTKRNVVSLATCFYDPLGVISPITVRFKLLFQRLCEKKLNWDEPLTGELLVEWESLTSDLQQFKPIEIPRYYTQAQDGAVNSYSLQGYCDASQRTYAAVVYLQVETEDTTLSQFLCSKTRVAPVTKVTIPRLQRLSALCLARLVSTVRRALAAEIPLSALACHTDALD